MQEIIEEHQLHQERTLLGGDSGTERGPDRQTMVIPLIVLPYYLARCCMMMASTRRPNYYFAVLLAEEEV